MGYRIYLCPQGHVQEVAEGDEPEDSCGYIMESDAIGDSPCGAQPLTEVDDPQHILTLAQELDVERYYGRDSVHVLADTALWKRMLQLDPDFARAYLSLLQQHDWGY